MFGVGISFISVLHISFKGNVCRPIHVMAAESKGDPWDLGSSVNWLYRLVRLKIRWPCLAFKKL